MVEPPMYAVRGAQIALGAPLVRVKRDMTSAMQ